MKPEAIRIFVRKELEHQIHKVRSDKSFPITFEKRFGRQNDKYLVGLKIWKTPKTIGYGSRLHNRNCKLKDCKCPLDKQVFVADFDDTSLPELFRKFTHLADKFKVPFFFFQTREDGKHFHCVSPAIFTMLEFLEIGMSAGVARKNLGFGLSTGHFVLRFVPKDERKFQIQYVGCVYPKRLTKTRNFSKTHLAFWQKIYEFPLEDLEPLYTKTYPLQMVSGALLLDNYFASNFIRGKK